MENFIDTKLEALLGGYHSTLLGANILLSIALIIIGLVLSKGRKGSEKKATIGPILVFLGLVLTVFNVVRTAL
ncbi:hypothetical protein ACFDTO_15100 [Microbacteriaceae bacterium 4G12]